VSNIRSANLFRTHFVASLALQSSVASLNIYNQSQIIKLTSPTHFIHGGKWHVVSDQDIDIDAVMRNCLEFDSGQDILEGALLCRIQRQHTGFNKYAQDESRHIWLLVAWRVECTEGLHVRALLVEHDKESNWDEDKLKRLYQKYWHSLNTWLNPVGSDWLLDDATVLTTTVKIMNGGYRCDISIYEIEEGNIKRPLWIDVER
jgi:hypothetical protein